MLISISKSHVLYAVRKSWYRTHDVIETFVFKSYAESVFLFEMCRFEIQRNQKFNRFFVNFRFFNLDDFNSNNLSTFCELDDSFTRDALNVNNYEVFAEDWHNDQLTLEFRDRESELQDNIDENDYLTTLFFHLRHHCLSFRMCWKRHMMLFEDVNDNYHNEDDWNNREDENENNDKDDNEKKKICDEHWFWFWWY